jgi:hypothetical protein
MLSAECQWFQGGGRPLLVMWFFAQMNWLAGDTVVGLDPGWLCIFTR